MTEILYEELSEKISGSELTLVDLRTKEEIGDTAKLPGAHCLPVQELPAALKLSSEELEKTYGFTLPPPQSADTSKVVFYCRSGRRVGIAHELLKEAGYANHRLYFGSYCDWIRNGGATDKS